MKFSYHNSAKLRINHEPYVRGINKYAVHFVNVYTFTKKAQAAPHNPWTTCVPILQLFYSIIRARLVPSLP